jgi:hypothetical protein
LAPQHHVFVRLTSNPSGARVLVDGKAYGPTPADIEIWGDVAEPGKDITFTFEKDGYLSMPVTRRIQDEKFSVDTVLQRVPGTEPTARKRGGEKTGGAGPKVVVTPDNFKEDPY